MRIHFRWVTWVWILALLVGAPCASGAQIEPWDQKFNSGQDVVPVFEGWERKPDGSFTMAFGYLNRNYVEEVIIPVGPNNNIEPGGPDRGQPGYFYPRVNRYSFKVNVPKDWGRKELVWTLTVHGKTEKAYGSLLPIWEIDRLVEISNDGGVGGSDQTTIEKNQPPRIVIDPVNPVTLPHTLTLMATVTDDGLPKPQPRPKPAVGQETPPTLKYKGEPSPINVPLPTSPTPPIGLSVGWFVYRGPAKVTFDPDGYKNVKGGKTVVTATVTEAGTYVLRAIASDGMLKTRADVTVTVNARPTPQN